MKPEFKVFYTEKRIVIDLSKATFIGRLAICLASLFGRNLIFKNPRVIQFKLKQSKEEK